MINQNRYSIFDRTIEKNGLKDTAKKLEKGIIAFSPLAQGLLTDRYLKGIPEDSRIMTDGRFLKKYCSDRRKTCENQRTERTGSRKRSDIGRDGIELDFEGWYCNKRSCRRIKTGTGIG